MFSGVTAVIFDDEEKRGRNMLKTAATSELYMISCFIAGGDPE